MKIKAKLSEETKKQLRGEKGDPGVEGQTRFTAYDLEQYTLADMAGLCRFWQGYWMFPPINSRSLIADLLSAATGMEIDETEATRIAQRVINLVRAYNVREGFRRGDDFDSIPKHAFQRAVHPTEGKLDPAEFNEMIDNYYEVRGWTHEGIPTKKTLEESGLDYVAQDLERRGVLTD